MSKGYHPHEGRGRCLPSPPIRLVFTSVVRFSIAFFLVTGECSLLLSGLVGFQPFVRFLLRIFLRHTITLLELADQAFALAGDYYALFLLAGFLAGALASPARSAYWRSPAPLISAVTAVIVLSPHIYWLYSTHFALFHNLAAHLGATPLGEVLKQDAVYIAAALGYAGLIVTIWWIVVRPSPQTWREAWRDGQ